MKARKMLVMAGVSAALWVGLPGTAWAGHCPAGATYPADCPHPPQVSGEDVSRDVAPFSEVQGRQVSRGGGAAGRLPVTGGDVVGLTIMALGAIGAGGLLVRRTRTSAI